MDSRQAEFVQKQERLKEDKWTKPFQKSERFEKLNPQLSREYVLSSGETITVSLSDQEMPENVIATPKRKALSLLVKSAHPDISYDVEARFSANPTTIYIGIPDPEPGALMFDAWEPEIAGAVTNPSPFLSTLMEIDDLEVRLKRIKI